MTCGLPILLALAPITAGATATIILLLAHNKRLRDQRATHAERLREQREEAVEHRRRADYLATELEISEGKRRTLRKAVAQERGTHEANDT